MPTRTKHGSSTNPNEPPKKNRRRSRRAVFDRNYLAYPERVSNANARPGNGLGERSNISRRNTERANDKPAEVHVGTKAGPSRHRSRHSGKLEKRLERARLSKQLGGAPLTNQAPVGTFSVSASGAESLLTFYLPLSDKSERKKRKIRDEQRPRADGRAGGRAGRPSSDGRLVAEHRGERLFPGGEGSPAPMRNRRARFVAGARACRRSEM